jgi:glycosyltransferase involved in cell wall biosynthesis
VTHPLVSVVTPFHNTAKYLAECIESVLAQSYPHFEYLLVDNCSTDGSSEIAESFAQRDSRIRLIKRTQLVPQVQNYNLALREISEDSKYCKIVQADDFIFPECLGLMVEAFERSPTVGLVSAYDLKGNVVRGSGFPYRESPFAGREVVRMYFRSQVFVFGSPTTVMYRSSLIHGQKAFFEEGLLHEDTEKCIQILSDWDFGFVYQVLSFLRVDDRSLSAASRSYEPIALDRYIVVRKYARMFLDDAEASSLRQVSKKFYYRILAKSAIRFRETAFWKYHEEGLGTIGEKLDWVYLVLQVGRELARLAANPGSTISHILRSGTPDESTFQYADPAKKQDPPRNAGTQ